jgi:hypothetical protein
MQKRHENAHAAKECRSARERPNIWYNMNGWICVPISARRAGPLQRVTTASRALVVAPTTAGERCARPVSCPLLRLPRAPSARGPRHE